MSSSKVKQIEIFTTDSVDEKLTIKGLAVKEDSMVVSHIIASENWRTNVLNHPEKDLRTKFVFPFKVDNTVSESQIIDYIENGLGLTNLTFKRSETAETFHTIVSLR